MVLALSRRLKTISIWKTQLTNTTRPRATLSTYDDHGHLQVYHLLFARDRTNVRNVTEVGISKGRSVQIWCDLFPKATIFGNEVNIDHTPTEHLLNEPRVRVIECNLLEKGKRLADIGIAEGSIHIIIEDGSHDVPSQDSFLNFLIFSVASSCSWWLLRH